MEAVDVLRFVELWKNSGVQGDACAGKLSKLGQGADLGGVRVGKRL